MKKHDSFAILMGIFRYSSKKKIPADSRALHQTLFRLSKTFPDVVEDSIFDIDGIQAQLTVDLDNMMLEGMLGMSGSNMETLIIDDKLINHFDENISHHFTTQQIETIKVMGEKLPRLLTTNESSRYKSLKSSQIS